MSFKIPKNTKYSPENYALWCTLKRALRAHHEFNVGGSGIVLLVAPKGYSPTRYKVPLVAQLYPSGDFRSEDIGFMYVHAGDNPAKMVSEFRSECQNKHRAVVIAEHGTSIPSALIVGTDMVINLSPVGIRDFQAACGVTLGLRVTEEQAREALSYPDHLMWASLRRGRSISSALDRLAAVSSSEQPDQTKSQIALLPLEQMHGYGPAKTWGLQLAQDLTDWKAGQIGWSDVDQGIVLSGPPGVGKTIFARALAQNCGVKLIATSLGQWQAKGHLGDLLKAMRRDFASAKEEAPCILFVDEVDSIGNRSTFRHENADYSVQVVNAFLECLDGLDGREGVVVVAATNNVERIDPAVLRAGRLDRHVEIPLPSGEDRIAILKQHLREDIDDDQAESLRAATSGMTGADLAKVARDARRLARRERRRTSLDDVKASLPPVVKIEGEYRRAIAVHEAGHTIVGIRLKHGQYRGTRIVDQVVVSSSAQIGGAAQFELPSISRRDRQHFLDQIAVMLAGLAAEEVVLGSTGEGAGIGEASDLAHATRLATIMEASLGMGATYRQSRAYNDEELETLRRTDRELSIRIDYKLAAQFERAKEILEGERDFLDLVTAELVATGSLTPERISQLERALQAERPKGSPNGQTVPISLRGDPPGPLSPIRDSEEAAPNINTGIMISVKEVPCGE